MNIYVKKQLWKISLLLGALGIALSSLFYTNSIVDKLAEAEIEGIVYTLINEGENLLSLKETDEWFNDDYGNDDYDNY